MIVSELKGYVVKKLGITVIAVAVIYFSAYYTRTYMEKIKQDTIDIKRKFATNAALKTQLNAKVLEIQSLGEFWNRINLKEKSGLKVQILQNLIETLSEIYRIDSLNVKLSTPVVNERFESNKFSRTQQSEVNLRFSSLTDKDAILFILSLMEQVPGYMQIKDLSFISADIIDEQVLDGIKLGAVKSLVNVNVVFNWEDIELVEQ